MAFPRGPATGIDLEIEQQIDDLSWWPMGLGIRRDEAGTIWHAGHVSALLATESMVIVGTESGGVWRIDVPRFARPDDRYTATSLSDDWDTPDVRALAFGPDDQRHVYVGCEMANDLFLIDLQGPKVSRIPVAPWLTVNGIAVLPRLRRIVLSTNSGVKWSQIPSRVDDLMGYAWRAAEGVPPAEVFYSEVAVGAEDSVVVACWAPKDAPPDRIYRGTWSLDGVLAFKPAILDISAANMLRTSIASCGDHPNEMYAVAAGANEAISTVLRSSSDGRFWTAVAIPEGAGIAGSYNNCIAVSPYRPDVVVIGWQSGGPFFSVDGGQHWRHDFNDINNLSLHPDQHALHFVRNAQRADRLYVGSDGGIAYTPDLGASFTSVLNEGLANLQFYGAQQVNTAGSLAISSRFPGLVAGGTQDNGNLYADGLRSQGWRTLEGGDGGPNRFIEPLAVLINWTNALPSEGVQFYRWDANTRTFSARTSIKVEGQDTPVLPFGVLEPVRNPVWRKDKQLMYACAGTSTGAIYGLFANPDGTDCRVRKLADVPFRIMALGSFDGRIVHVAGPKNAAEAEWSTGGPQAGIFFTETGEFELQQIPIMQGIMTKIEVISTGPAYALVAIPRPLDSDPTPAPFETQGLSGLLRYGHDRGMLFGHSEWRMISDHPWSTFAVDVESGRIFATTDEQVYVSRDDGATWSSASNRLPARPHCTDLRIAADGRGGRLLYLATYGRSVWWAQIALPPPRKVPDIPLTSDPAWRFVLEWFNVATPSQPARDLLTAFVISELAATMSAPNDSALQRAALQQIVQIAEREAGSSLG